MTLLLVPLSSNLDTKIEKAIVGVVTPRAKYATVSLFCE